MNELQHLTGIWIATIMCDALILFFLCGLLQAICLLVKEKLSKEALEKTAKEKDTKVRHFQHFLYRTYYCYSCKFLAFVLPAYISGLAIK